MLARGTDLHVHVHVSQRTRRGCLHKDRLYNTFTCGIHVHVDAVVKQVLCLFTFTVHTCILSVK